ncbi:MAG: SDR family NAD(P)-dependent oxidoreductase, partial [Myxococcota bacterium]
MLKNDFTNKAVLITGGTKGIGLAIGLAFAKEGAQVYLTYKWGSGQHDALARVFTDAGALAPILVEADAA